MSIADKIEKPPAELAELWGSAVGELKRSVPAAVYDSWLSSLKPLSVGDEGIVLLAEEGSAGWVRDRFKPIIERCVTVAFKRDLDVVITETPAQPERVATQFGRQTLNPRYTFDQFVIGENNMFAHAAALTISELPGQAYNPLFIHGPNGVGKTHLLQAIANYVHRNTPSLTVSYATVETFTNEFVASLKNGDINRFKQYYRDLDILLIDDVQFLEGKEQTQEEFFHTFNALYECGSQLVITSDRPPAELKTIHNRLQSRFEYGLAIEVEPPPFKTRVAILKKRAQIDGIEILDDGVVEAIASRVSSSVRSLEGALIRSVAYASLTQSKLSPEIVEKVVGALYGHRTDQPCTVSQIRAEVCSYYDVDDSDLSSSSRSSSVTLPRHVAMYLSREMTGLSLPKIAREFSRQDHTTVINASEKISSLIKRDSSVRGAVQEIRESILTR